MRPTQLLGIAVPNEMAEAIKTNVATGEYATEGDVICEGPVLSWHVIRRYRNDCEQKSVRPTTR